MCPQGENPARGKEASEEAVKAQIVVRKPVQEKSCTRGVVVSVLASQARDEFPAGVVTLGKFLYTNCLC